MAKPSALILTTVLVLGTLLCGVAAGELKKGSRGARVEKVQKWVGQTADGVYGKATRAAVRR